VDEILEDEPGLAQFVMPLLAYECPVEGMSLAARFASEQANRLAPDDRRWIELQLATHLGVWEMLHVQVGAGVDAVNLLTGERRFIHEISGSRTLARRDTILGRVVVADDVVVFCGIHESPLGPAEADTVISGFTEAQLPSGSWAATTRLIALWNAALRERERKAATPTIVTNTDGHHVVMIEDHFTLAKGAFAAAFAKLAGFEGALVDEHDRKGASLSFTRPGNAMHSSWENTIIGSARLTATKLVVCANSVERGDALRAQVESAIGALATWRTRNKEKMRERFSGEKIAIDAQATDSPSTKAMYRSWLDTPVPGLGGRTPREASETEDGRRRVHLHLKVMENRHARKPQDGLDPPQLRRELGLDDLGAPLADLDLDRAMGSGRKISETLLDFVRPLLEVVEAQQNEQRLRGVLAFGIRVWNLVVMEQQRGSSGELALTRVDIKPGEIPADILVWFDRLVARKRSQFAADLRLVGNWRIHRTAKMFNIEMAAHLDGPLAERAVAAGLMIG
jgi:hypothetical protein